jgi:alpha-L-fucosidase
MSRFAAESQRPAGYQRFVRPVPAWFRESGLGIFIHWGAYSVPAWAEPIGELGTIEKRYWFAHNPYAEWYYNTIRIDGSPARRHHQDVYGGAPYDAFLDRWQAEAFDPADLAALFRRAGAGFVIPTTKHHDGITLWDAPGTDGRNTVHRGPKRDLVAELATATRAEGLRFGVYYSTGLDWHAAPTPPIVDEGDGFPRPHGADYAQYVYRQVMDLIDRYSPDVLWGDIGYPDAGLPEGPYGLAAVFDRFYAEAPDGVVNDRWGLSHWDFRTSEYQQGLEVQGGGRWQSCRGIGYSFGYNRCEDASHYLDSGGAVRELLDVVSRGGNFLLNVGPDAAGAIPPLQRSCLEGMAEWMAANRAAVHAVEPVDPSLAPPAAQPWIRWTRNADHWYAAVDARGVVHLPCDADAVDPASATTPEGTAVAAQAEAGGCRVDIPPGSPSGPAVVRFRRR